MNKKFVIILILVLVVSGVYIVTQQAKKAAEQKVMQKAAEEANRLAAEARKALYEAELVKQRAIAEAKRAEELARQKAAVLQARLSALTEKAKILLNDGKFQEAIDTAKSILSQDADHAQAKSILETAATKLQDFVQQQAGVLQENGKKTLESLTTSLNEAATQ